MNKIAIVVGMFFFMNFSVYGADTELKKEHQFKVEEVTLDTFLSSRKAKSVQPKTPVTLQIIEHEAICGDSDSDDEDGLLALGRVLSTRQVAEKSTVKTEKPKIDTPQPISVWGKNIKIAALEKERYKKPEIIPVSELFRDNQGPYNRAWSRSIHNATIVAMLSMPEENKKRLDRYMETLKKDQKPSPRRNALTDDSLL